MELIKPQEREKKAGLLRNQNIKAASVGTVRRRGWGGKGRKRGFAKGRKRLCQ